jgi:predicted transport protein
MSQVNTLYDVPMSRNITQEEILPLLYDISNKTLSYYLLYHTLKNIVNIDNVPDPITKLHDIVVDIHK